ncbi:MAG TPA: hypothetical protein DD671_04415, partial [Balneolaceae bacterium]|nr:hypothetical protein [Balneolaceae bacterium]
VNIRIKVLRDNTGNWEVLIDSAVTGNFVSQGTISDNDHTSSSYFGLVANYTSTRSELLYFDDFFINVFRIDNAQAHSNETIDVDFNFPVDAATLENSDFTLSDGLGSPQQTQLVNSDLTARLDYGQDIPNGNYTLTVNDLDDTFGNSLPANSQINFTFANPFELTATASPQNDQILLTLSEDLNASTVETGDFMVNDGSIDPATGITFPEDNQILLAFSNPLPSGSVEIEVSGFESVNGWTIPSGSSGAFFIYDDYQAGDIVINEF